MKQFEFVNEKLARKYSRTEIAAFCDKEIESYMRRFGSNSYWVQRAIENKNSKLDKFDNGEAVAVFTDSTFKDGFEHAITYMSDGSTETSIYSCD